MAAASTHTRPPVVAGLFYPESAAACRDYATRLLAAAPQHAATVSPVRGVMVPHAGWICSGAVAAEALAHAGRHSHPDVIVLLGAVHAPLRVSGGAMDTHAAWTLPSGEMPLPRELAAELQQRCSLLSFEPRLHEREHSMEVEAPLLQMAFPGVAVLPIAVVADAVAHQVGYELGAALEALGRDPLLVASSDLTHYGKNYGLTPRGVGKGAMDWAMQNDRRLLALIERLADDEVVNEARDHHNACGAGAVAAMLAACRHYGARRAQILNHTSSYETLGRLERQPGDISVGYAAVAVG
jgi:AmmeMemoRadiSam system protein B